MRTPNYVVPDHGLGAVRSIPTVDVDAALVRQLLEGAGAETADIQVTLLQHGEDLGFHVAHRDRILGTLPEAEALEYPELAHITAAGLTPEVTAQATKLDDGDVALHLRLPHPGLCIPANEPPSEPWALVQDGDPRTVLYYPDAAERDVDTRMSLLVRLGFDEAGDIIASLGNEGVGRLDSRTASELTPTLRNFERRGLVLVTRGYHAPTAQGAELTVNLGGAQELGAPQALSPIPFLPLAEAERLPELVPAGAAEAPEEEAAEISVAQPVATPSPQFKADDDAAAAALAAESTPDTPAEQEDEEDKAAQMKKALHPACLTAGAILIVLIVAGVIAISSQWVGENSAMLAPAVDQTVAEAQTAPR